MFLHPQQRDSLLTLEAGLSRDTVTDETCAMLLHTAIWHILCLVSDEFKRDSLRDPFTLYLIASHIRENYTTFAHVGRFTPAISMAQWCLRATSVQQIDLLRAKYEGNVHMYVYY